MPDFDRQADMIETTLDRIADLGIQATTVQGGRGTGRCISNG